MTLGQSHALALNAPHPHTDRRPQHFVQLVALAVVVLLSACSRQDSEVLDRGAANSCVFALDGVCDEPRNCALGSDSSDCDRACAEAYTPSLAAACDYDQPPEQELVDSGSRGDGGLGGRWEGSIMARDPVDPQKSIPRYYRVYVPPHYDSAKPTPLLFVLGGFRVDNHSLPAYTELDRLADQQRIIVVYLQAHFLEYGSSGWVFQWYVFRQNWKPSDWTQNPDVDFVRKLSDELKGLYNIDRTRIYASGHSRGGAASIMLAFEAPDLLAGYLSQSGFSKTNQYQSRMLELSPARKVSGVIVHGVADKDVPISEGDSTAQAMRDSGHVEGEHFAYYRLEGVTHQWQPQLNGLAWNFLENRPLPLEMASP